MYSECSVVPGSTDPLDPIIVGDYANSRIYSRDKAKKFAAENPHLILTETGSFTREIIEAEKTKDPTKLNKRIQNFRELYSVKEKLQVLEEKKEEIEKGTPLKEVKAEIEARKEKIKELESQLWSD